MSAIWDSARFQRKALNRDQALFTLRCLLTVDGLCVLFPSLFPLVALYNCFNPVFNSSFLVFSNIKVTHGPFQPSPPVRLQTVVQNHPQSRTFHHIHPF